MSVGHEQTCLQSSAHKEAACSNHHGVLAPQFLEELGEKSYCQGCTIHNMD